MNMYGDCDQNNFQKNLVGSFYIPPNILKWKKMKVPCEFSMDGPIYLQLL